MESIKNKCPSLNQTIGLAYLYLFYKYESIKQFEHSIFIICKTIFKNFRDYYNNLSQFKINSNENFLQSIYNCESNEELNNFFQKIPVKDKLKVNEIIRLKILQSAHAHFLKSGDILMDLIILNLTGHVMCPLIADPYLKSRFKQKEKSNLIINYTSSFNKFYKLINVGLDINLNNLDTFFENLPGFFNGYYIESNEFVSIDEYNNELFYLLLYLPRFIMFNKIELCEAYLQRLLIYYKINCLDYEEKEEWIFKIKGKYFNKFI
jgi:hypothetical protein